MISEKLLKFYESKNIAEELDDELLAKIGQRVCQDFDTDEGSRQEWLKMNEEAIKIAKQVLEEKSTPWPNAANVKYPLITSAVISFASRTYPELVRGDKVVQVGVIGPDEDGQKEQLARRVSDHMSYQLLVESPNWETDTDKLLTILPLMGLVYRKSYFDHFSNIPASDLCLPDKITINNSAKSLESARRVTHQLDLYQNDIIERVRMGFYSDIDLDKIRENEGEDDDPVYEFVEQHRYWDLDDDGYQEPYIITVHYKSQTVFRIKARFELDDIIFNDKGKIARIPATNYFTDYHFLRSPDGSFHSMGYGALLYPINETINTTINQLLDAGTLEIRAPGLITKRFRNLKGNQTFRLGEYKMVDVPDNMAIANGIYRLPTPSPSPVLFQLLGMMVNAGKELASITDIMEGNQPTQNSPATTVLALLEQGLKDQKAILKRLYRSFTKEFQKLAFLNKKYLDNATYFNLFTGEGHVSRNDYADKKLLIFPAADPTMSSDAQRLARAQALMQGINMPEVNRREVLLRYLDALQVPMKEKILNPPPDPNAPPPPEVEKLEAEIGLLRMQSNDILMGRELEALRLQQQDNVRQAQAAEGAARIQRMHDEMIARFAEIDAKFGALTLKEAELQQAAQAGQQLLPSEQQVMYQPSEVEGFLQKMNPPQPPAQPPMPPEQPLPEGMPPAPVLGNVPNQIPNEELPQ
jgi:chaperonin GroES